MGESEPQKPPYFKLAVGNPYNLSLFLGGLAVSALALNPIVALVVLGAEGLWMLHAPESKALRKLLWDPRYDQLRRTIEQRQREERLRALDPAEQRRVNTLVARQQEIDRLAAQNPSFTGDLLRSELQKTRKLVAAFVDMALTCARYERYLDTVDLNELDRERQRFTARAASKNTPDAERELAKKNAAVIDKRIEKLRDIRNYLGVARGQLDLIENSFQLIADQIVTMQSPAELSGQLDDLLDGVESIRQTAVDTEKILQEATTS